MPSETAESNKQVVRRLYDECINPGNFDRLAEYVADDFVGVQGERGPLGMRGTLAGVRGGFPDIHFTLEDVMGDGDRVAVRWTWKGTHQNAFRGFAATHKPFTNTAIAIYQLRDGKITRAWMQSDRLGFLEQVGAVPAGLAGPQPPRPQ